MRILQNVAPPPEAANAAWRPPTRRNAHSWSRRERQDNDGPYKTQAVVRVLASAQGGGLQIDEPVRVLVLTTNTTLKGYIENLAEASRSRAVPTWN